MPFRRLFLAVPIALAAPVAAFAQAVGEGSPTLSVELNAMRNVGGACRLTFLTQNRTGASIGQAVFETVIIDASGGVVSLSLFDFRDLPADRPRVREFDVPNMACENVGQVLINGVSKCSIDGADSGVCAEELTLSSRLDVELLG